MKRTILIAVLALVCVVIFSAGLMLGKKNALDLFSREFIKAKHATVLGNYLAYRDIARELKNGQFELARCNAELMAGAMFDTLSTCLEDDVCREMFDEKLSEVAPEIFDKMLLKFDYRYTIDELKKCEE